MMAAIRKLVYKIGLRPKFGSIFYSPSTVVLLNAQNVAKYFNEGYAQAINVLRAMPEQQHIEEWKTPRTRLYAQMIYCMICSTEMDTFMRDIKECPNLCGRAYPSDDTDGLPVIIFQPSE